MEPAPEPTAFDYGMTIAKVAAVGLPFVGSGVALFDLITAPLRGRRFNDWCERLRVGVNELSERVEGLTPEKLAASEEFNSAFAQAAQGAIKTHQEDKLDALRNAVLNVAAGSAPDEARQAVYLSLIDRFTATHLKVLKQFENDKPLSPFVDWVKKVVPALQQEDAHFIRMLISDLYSAGLIAYSPETGALESGGHFLSNFGWEFLLFIGRSKL